MGQGSGASPPRLCQQNYCTEGYGLTNTPVSQLKQCVLVFQASSHVPLAAWVPVRLFHKVRLEGEKFKGVNGFFFVPQWFHWLLNQAQNTDAKSIHTFGWHAL